MVGGLLARNRTDRVESSIKPCLIVFAILLMLSGTGPAQEPQPQPQPELSEFEKTSLTLRTALHFDSAISAPLESLVKLYQNEDRVEDLIGLYRAHIAQYPEDAGAKAVLIRILRKLNRAEAGEVVTVASQLHPENSVIQHLLYQHLNDRNDPKTLEVLSKAIDLEKENAVRRNGWLEELLKASGEGVGRNLAAVHLTTLLSAEGHTAETLQALSVRMQRYGFWELSLVAVTEAFKKSPAPEMVVDLQIMAAKAEGALGNREQAGIRLDGLLAKLAQDHWRRREIMSMRVNLLANDAEREAMLAAAKSAFDASPENESAVLDYVELLAASELRRDAADVLVKASEVLPKSERVEAKTLEMLERIADERGMETYLEKRITTFPERDDLRYRLVKAQFLLGKVEPARENLALILNRLPGGEKAPKILDLARYLRQANLSRQAIVLFEQFLKSYPDRLDVARELAETRLTLEERDAARAGLANLEVSDAEIENVIDVVQFMLREEFYVEAKATLEKRLAAEPDQFELRLLLFEVLGATGNRDEVEKLLDSTRQLADTAARYRNWLETAMEVHELFGDATAFFDAEQARFADTKEPAEIEKFLILCDTGKKSKLTARVTQAIKTQLSAEGMAADVRIQMRLLLVKALENDPDRAVEVEEQLKLLAKEDESRKDEYILRRALLYHELSRPDLTKAALAEGNVGNVTDVSVLRAAVPVLVNFGFVDAAISALKKVTDAEPDSLVNWEKRISLLAAIGREAELRKVIRDLLGRVDRVEINVESTELLRRHLLDSHWRSVAGLIAKDTPEALAEVLPLLESVERETHSEDRLWGLWARAYALNALGRTAARDAAIEELTAAAHANSVERETGEAMQIHFPDGLAISLSAAMDLLTDPNSRQTEAPRKPTEGPLNKIDLAWAFEVDGGAKVIQTEPIGDSLVLILDDRGTIYSVDAATGKLKWRERFVQPDRINAQGLGSSASGGNPNANQYFQVQQGGSLQAGQPLGATIQSEERDIRDVSGVKRVRQFVTDGDQRFFLEFGDRIHAYASSDGALLWSSELGDGREAGRQKVSALAQPDTELALDGKWLICHAPRLGTVAGYSAETGKQMWKQSLTTELGENLFSLNTGMAVQDGKVFVFGRESFVLNAANGEAIWNFEGGEVASFPVQLRDSSGEAASVGGINTGERWAGADPKKKRESVNYFADEKLRGSAVKLFMEESGSLVGPAVEWSVDRLSSPTAAFAAIAGDRLLLMNEQGLIRISLSFPLSARHFEARGVYLGAVGGNAWFLNGDSVVRIDLTAGENAAQSEFEISLSGLVNDGEASGVLSGSRVYVTGPNGIAVFNAHSGKLISESRWPDALITYRERLINSSSKDPAARSSYVFQGIVRAQPPGIPSTALRPMDRTSGMTIYATLGESSVVAIRGQ